MLDNARELGIDLSGVTDLVLSHHHGDHTGGLIALREALSKKNPAALSRAHVGDGIFLSRPSPEDGQETNPMIARRAAYEAAGGKFLIHARPVEILPGVWLTGPVPRPNPERLWPHSARLQTPQGVVEDSIPEDASLIIDTPEGLVVITGCGHAGIINTIEYARSAVRQAPAFAVIGGLHLFRAATRPRVDRDEAEGVRTGPPAGSPLHRHRGGLPHPPAGRPHPQDRGDRRDRIVLQPGGWDRSPGVGALRARGPLSFPPAPAREPSRALARPHSPVVFVPIPHISTTNPAGRC